MEYSRAEDKNRSAKRYHQRRQDKTRFQGETRIKNVKEAKRDKGIKIRNTSGYRADDFIGDDDADTVE